MLNWLAGRAWIGVDVFFVLSGFLITWILIDEVADTGSVNVGRFYLRRALRLQPAYCSALILNVAAYWLLMPSQFGGIRSALPYYLTYTMNEVVAVGLIAPPAYGVVWSLCIEEQFYLGWSFVVRRLGLNGRLLLNLCIYSIALILIHRSLVYVRLNQGHVFDPTLFSLNRIKLATDTRIDTILVGCAMALSMRDERFVRLWNRLSYSPRTGSTVAVIGLMAIAGCSCSRFIVHTIGYTIIAFGAAAVLTKVFLFPLSRVGTCLSWGPLVWLGKISYGMYLFHPLIWSCIARLTFARSYQYGVGPLLMLFVLTWFCTVAFSKTHHYLVEKRF